MLENDGVRVLTSFEAEVFENLEEDLPMRGVGVALGAAIKPCTARKAQATGCEQGDAFEGPSASEANNVCGSRASSPDWGKSH